jgi:hypothetical protein
MRLRNAAGTRVTVPDHMVARYLARGWVNAGGGTPPPAPTPHTPPPPPPGVFTLTGGAPDGTAKDVLDWVGDNPDRALAALAAENAKGDDARSTLVARLTKLADQ